ncbi:MAG: GNAT family N-acetyltransferase [Patescibacteria group bacterium]
MVVSELKKRHFGRLFVKRGLTKKQTSQLVFYSRTDKEIKHNTSDFYRFSDIKKVESWLALRRVVYTLTDKPGNLLGIIWFGLKKIPLPSKTKIDASKHKVTFAIRLYDRARGKRLAGKFMKQCFSDYIESRQYQKMEKPKFWLEVSFDNTPAIKLYRRFGFRKVTKPNKNGKIIMVLNPIQ